MKIRISHRGREEEAQRTRRISGALKIAVEN
jgi:hypothetical protein